MLDENQIKKVKVNFILQVQVQINSFKNCLPFRHDKKGNLFTICVVLVMVIK